MAVCIAILTKDNCPLYLTCENTEDSLKMHFLVHTSIDVIEEKLNSTKAANDPRSNSEYRHNYCMMEHKELPVLVLMIVCYQDPFLIAQIHLL